MEPLQITIPANELEQWLEHIKRGIEPAVKFSDDPAKMQADAYKERGDMLYYLNHRIRAYMPNDEFRDTAGT
jgi:hypothetical protein